LRGRNARVEGDQSGREPKRYGHTFGDTPETITVPTNPSGRVQLSVTASGRLDGWDATYWPIKPPGV
jgi:hypothetical protein